MVLVDRVKNEVMRIFCQTFGVDIGRGNFNSLDTMNWTDLTSTQLKQAAAIKDQIAQLQTELANVLQGNQTVTQKNKRGRPAKIKTIAAALPVITAESKVSNPAKSGMSLAGKRRIAQAQKLRWAKVRAAKETGAQSIDASSFDAPVSQLQPKRREMSAEAKAKISAAQTARWNKARSSKGGKKSSK